MIDRRPGATLRSLGAEAIVVACRRGNGPEPDSGAADTIAVVPVDGCFVTILCARGVGEGRLCL